MMQVPQVANESAKLRQELHELLDKYGTSDRGDLEGTEQTASVAGSIAHVAGSAVIAAQAREATSAGARHPRLQLPSVGLHVSRGLQPRAVLAG
mmetsp:Transcript_91195/g.232112  ORF Transcript_91195/g.232112 Transcript_91195/m.232112 type:complete len:94 (-) Transcript_91195:1563-1844(-)